MYLFGRFEMIHSVPIAKYFPATISCLVHTCKTNTLMKKKLTEAQLGFGPLLDIDLVLNGQLFHHFLLREVTDENPDVISFSIMGKKVTFTQDNFNLITRLWPVEERSERDTSSERPRDLILETNVHSKPILCKDVEIASENKRFLNDEDVVKVALALYIEKW